MIIQDQFVGNLWGSKLFSRDFVMQLNKPIEQIDHLIADGNTEEDADPPFVRKQQWINHIDMIGQIDCG